ncbi:MAG: serine hydrolase domain-containing protein [Acidimicrobiales bacterium]
MSREFGTRLTQAIETEFAEHGDIPGMVVAVRSPEGTYENAFGWANVETKAPMSVDAIFGIGSVHKVFKWTTLHLLAQDGLIDLDGPVNDYTAEPELPGVTVRHLVQHSSGMPDLPDIEDYNNAIAQDQTRLFSYDDVLSLLGGSSGSNSYGSFANGRLSDFVPGQNMSYSSIGPVVGNRIVETVTGINARVFTAERIFEPLALDNTSFMGFEPDPERLADGYATPETVNQFFPTAEATMGLSSANGGALHSTAADVADFGHTLFVGNGLLTATTQDELFTSPLQGPGMRAGNGIIQFDAWRESGWWGHAGFGIRSHSSVLLHQPDIDLTVVVITNVYTPLDDYRTNVAVADAILREFRSETP